MNESFNAPESPGRRRLFATLLVSTGGAIAAFLLGALGTLTLAPLRKRPGVGGRVDVGPLAGFEPTKSGTAGPQEVVVSRTVEDGYAMRKVKERVLVVKDASSPAGLAFFSPTCSHLGCGVSFSAEKKAFLCPCHGGVYAEDGRVVSGPPPRPLTRLPLVVEGGRVGIDYSKLEA